MIAARPKDEIFIVNRRIKKECSEVEERKRMTFRKLGISNSTKEVSLTKGDPRGLKRGYLYLLSAPIKQDNFVARGRAEYAHSYTEHVQVEISVAD